ARAGDRLVLSKALGTGLITTALKRGQADPVDLAVAVESMSRLNCQAARLARSHGVRAMTDITGFGLAGHAREMLRADSLDFAIDFNALEWLPGARNCAEAGLSPGGTARNRDYFAEWTSLSPDLGEIEESMIHDPQTSGGLLMAVPAERARGLLHALLEAGEAARLIGSVVPGSGRVRISSEPGAVDSPG
ncbi:MAG: selenide, water dikinase SelD, partial [Anaerolineaceae bacterium]|nr:selenide, water dikinase SelD [Anaerolineaceae bacterium]